MKPGLVYATGLVVLLVLLALPAWAHPPAAPSADTYDLSWWTVDGGGMMNASAGTYALTGTLGQPDAAALASSGGYALGGGFWFAALPDYAVFLPVVIKGS